VRRHRKEPQGAAVWEAEIDTFLSAVEPDKPESFFHALEALKKVDTLAVARDVVSRLACAYVAAGPDERTRLELDRSLSAFGHVIIARSEHATISFSVRVPKPSMAMNVLSTSNCHEYHRVERGSVRMLECAFTGERNGQQIFAPAAAVTLNAGAEIERRAGEAAFALLPVSRCLIFSVAGAITGDFKTSLDAATGAVLGKSFNHSRDSILVNVLELCAEFPDPRVGDCLAAQLAHRNHRVRLAALKACLMNETESIQALARRASTDQHPTIAGMGKHLLELAQ
jgi:hypothetical protein